MDLRLVCETRVEHDRPDKLPQNAVGLSLRSSSRWRRLVTVRSQLAEEVVKRDLDVGGEAGGIGVLAGNGAQGAARDGVGVSLGDLVRVEGVVVVTDDQGGDVDRPPTLD